ncbi:M56 family metallopeptidase [Botrimarina hoheduenensis]|uniref:BlaR1 peptidase M56 n=1 Tax=Botrimarina hoheduenensis TaxID=2528000 RepID=A0A5C5VY49_9BACT|nr:M56 family metallopeptidase [Botrimarina hoheduenensis]TWT42935.1 BlaR1 peptidase M56 [Botrimarina hoheduenensis]
MSLLKVWEQELSAVVTALADFHLGALFLLTVSLLLGGLLRQPARRLTLAWATIASLGLLAFLAALPGWSLWALTAAPPAAVIASPAALPALPATVNLEAPLSAPNSVRLPATADPATWEAPPLASSITPPAPPINWPALLVTAGAALLTTGTAVVLAWLGLGWRAGSRLVQQASPAPERCQLLVAGLSGASPAPRLLVSDRLAAPVAIGLRLPTILLPRTVALHASDDDLLTLLEHELAHVRHGDLWLLAGLRALLPLLWMHPLYWLLRRRVRLDQEALADAAAADLSSREAYAERLVNWARELAGQPQAPRLAGAAGLWEGPSQLRRRLVVLLDHRLTVIRKTTRRWRAACGLAFGSIALVASLVTLSPAEIKIAPPEQALPQSVETFTVRLVDAAGQPIADARVTPWALRSSQGHGWWRKDEDDPASLGPVAVTTDAAGEATIAYPHFRDSDEGVRTISVTVRVDHPDYVQVGDRHIDVPTEASPQVIRLSEGASVAVSALIDGQPADAAELHIVASDGRMLSEGTQPQREENTLSLPPMAAGPQVLRVVRIVDGRATHFSPLVELDLHEGQSIAQTVSLVPAATIHGLLGEEAPRPIIDGRVNAVTLAPSRDGPDCMWFTWAEVDAAGAFTIEDWPADAAIQLIALCQGYKATNGTAPPEETQVRDKDPYERPHVFRPEQFGTPLVLPMEPLVRCDVQTVDLDGQPVTGVKVVACPNVQWWNSGSQIYCDPLVRADRALVAGDYEATIDRNHAPEFWQEVDDQGRATLYLPVGRERLVVVSEEFELPVYLGSRDVEVILEAGQPISQRLFLQPRGAEQLGDWDKLAGVVFGCTTREGQRLCALPGVKQKVLEFRARLAAADNPRDPAILTEAYELIAEAFADAGDAEEAAKWCRKAAAEAAKVEDAGAASWPVPTSGVTAVAEFVASSDIQPTEINKAPEQGPGPGVLRIECVDEAGQPIVGARLECRQLFATSPGQVDSRLLAEGQSDAAGVCLFKGLPIDPARSGESGWSILRVRAEAPGYATGLIDDGRLMASSVFEHGGTGQIVMRPAATLTVRVVDHEGRPVVGATVLSSSDAFRADDPTLVTDENGVRVIENLAPGDDLGLHQQAVEGIEQFTQAWFEATRGVQRLAPARSLIVRHPDYAVASARIERVPCEQTIVVHPRTSISGRVLGVDGEPRAGYYIEAQCQRLLPRASLGADAFGMSRLGYETTTTDDSGRYAFDSLPQGEYLIRARKSPSLDVEVSDELLPEGKLVRAEDSSGITAPDLIATTGRLLRVQLIDDLTGEPVRPGRPMIAQLHNYPEPAGDDFSGYGFDRVPLAADGTFTCRGPQEAFWLDLVVIEEPAEQGRSNFYRDIKPRRAVLVGKEPSTEPITYRVINDGGEREALDAELGKRKEAGDTDEALFLYATMLSVRPDDEQLLWGRARLLAKLDRDAKAAQDYERLLAQASHYEYAHIAEVAWIYVAAKDPAARNPQRALELCERAIALRKPGVSLLDTYAMALAATGNPQKAVEVQRGVVENCQPESLEKYRNRLARYEAMLASE